jgi:calcineurin-like phosphoesterase
MENPMSPLDQACALVAADRTFQELDKRFREAEEVRDAANSALYNAKTAMEQNTAGVYVVGDVAVVIGLGWGARIVPVNAAI